MTNVPSARLDPPWPRQARAACAFTFDLDAETLWLARGVFWGEDRVGDAAATARLAAASIRG